MPVLSFFEVFVLSLVQGLAELLPVSSSAHVIVAEKFFQRHLGGPDPSDPRMTLLLVMLHTGTMFAVIVYFWRRWAEVYFRSAEACKQALARVALATVLTAVVGYPILKVIEKTMFKGAAKADIEQLFGRLDLVAVALFCVGVLIVWAGLSRRENVTATFAGTREDDRISMGQAALIGAVQGLALPFRGFSRSGSTISAGMLAGVAREAAETFSFALAVVLTPAVVGREALRLLKVAHEGSVAGVPVDLHGAVLASVLGMLFSFVAGLAALRWLSSWLEAGRWYLFGVYCVIFSFFVYYLHAVGY